MNLLGLNKIRALLERDRLDGLVVTKPTNVSYLSDFTGEGQLLISSTRQFLITDFRFQQEAWQEIKSFQLLPRESFVPLEETLANAVKKLKIKRLGFEANNLSFSFYQKLLKACPQITLVPTQELIERVRAIKTAREIQLLRKAASCAVASFAFAKNIIKEGKTEQEIAEGILYFMKKSGAETCAFDTIVASGKRTALPHARISTKTIKKNEAIIVDLGCLKDGYNSDLTRVVFLGKMSGKIKRIYDVVLRAQELAIQAVRAGEPIQKIDKIARHYITKAGFGPYFGHALGHGIGREVHEYPVISPRNQEAIQEGMVFTIEPGIYLPGLGGIRIEDMVLATKTGAEILTH
ncbi:MAG: Xaa-Pro peptidase family protein [Candidatus Omnitrophota bacterium]